MRPRPAAVRATAHALAADRMWHRRLTGAPVGTEIWADLPAGALRQRARETASDGRQLSSELEEAGLGRLARYQNSRGVAFQPSAADVLDADVLDHVRLYASHHRGHACAALRAAGAPPPTLDVITWVRAHL